MLQSTLPHRTRIVQTVFLAVIAGAYWFIFLRDLMPYLELFAVYPPTLYQLWVFLVPLIGGAGATLAIFFDTKWSFCILAALEIIHVLCWIAAALEYYGQPNVHFYMTYSNVLWIVSLAGAFFMAAAWILKCIHLKWAAIFSLIYLVTIILYDIDVYAGAEFCPEDGIDMLYGYAMPVMIIVVYFSNRIETRKNTVTVP